MLKWKSFMLLDWAAWWLAGWARLQGSGEQAGRELPSLQVSRDVVEISIHQQRALVEPSARRGSREDDFYIHYFCCTNKCYKAPNPPNSTRKRKEKTSRRETDPLPPTLGLGLKPAQNHPRALNSGAHRHREDGRHRDLPVPRSHHHGAEAHAECHQKVDVVVVQQVPPVLDHPRRFAVAGVIFA